MRAKDVELIEDVRAKIAAAPAAEVEHYRLRELMALIESNTPVPATRVCKRERCGREFSVQEGRGSSDRRRTSGVLYCSAKCARAQAAQDRRDREKKGASDQ